MQSWQKNLLIALDLLPDLNKIIGRQIRCGFPPDFENTFVRRKDALHTILGVIFTVDRQGGKENLGCVQFLLEPDGGPIDLSGKECLARPFLRYDHLSGWAFCNATRHTRPGREDKVSWSKLSVEVTWC